MKRSIYIAFLIVSLLSSCAKEINSELESSDHKAQAFMTNQSPSGNRGQFYFIKRQMEHPEVRPAVEVLRKYTELNMSLREAGNWESIHPALSQAIEGWLSDDAQRQDIGTLSAIEVTSYIYLNNYLLKAEASPALAKATAFYLRTLIDMQEASEWGILAKALVISKDALAADEYKSIAGHIRKNAVSILKKGPADHLPDDVKERQLQAAGEAVALLDK